MDDLLELESPIYSNDQVVISNLNRQLNEK